ncbi:uncharacterized protein LOC119650664 [Hermetia illucens]|uniref:uncharacterized protein LOC119650664 n=1 Tax=Hermetia illucens TaxID=343691 RepID=UPI0018CC3EFC|nr:uncharacterized protein LOC119650664 [Hermetia illucens]
MNENYFTFRDSPLYETQRIPQERMSLQKDEDPSRVFGRGRYLVPQFEVSTLAVDFNQGNYFELHESSLASCLRQGNIFLCASKEVMNNGTIWKEPMAANSWLYVTSDSTICSIS